MKVYIAGRIKYERTRFGLDVDIFREPDEYWITRYPEFTFFDHSLIYTGPFTVGCDHGCAHRFDHAVGPTCGDDQIPIDLNKIAGGDNLEQELRRLVIKKTTQGIKDADVVFAWLGSESQLAHGTLAEIGFAAGLNKPIYVGFEGKDSDDTWYAKTLATQTYIARSFKTFFYLALNDHFDSVGESCK